MHNLDLAYSIQRKFLKDKKIVAYKVGASNLISKNFFKTENIIVGGIQQKNIYKNEVVKNYQTAEIEVIVKIQHNFKDPKNYKILKTFIGIECPLPDIKNEIGSEFICIADNCSSGDLILIKEIKDTNIKTFDLIVSDINTKFKVNADLARLIYSVDEILIRTLDLIYKHNLPTDKEVFVATGGISDNFSLQSHQSLCLKL